MQEKERMVAESEQAAKKMRFGLFSQPLPLAVGDDGQYQPKRHARDDSGKPTTAPRQLLAGTCRSGVMKSSYISSAGTIYANDQYCSEYKRQVADQLKHRTRAKFHEVQWKPASGGRTLSTGAYKHSNEVPRQKKVPERDERGKPRTSQPNINSNPSSKVEDAFLKRPRYMEDEYGRQEQLRRQWSRESQAKKIAQCQFVATHHGNRPFSRDSQVYGADTQASLQRRRSHSATSISKYPHEGAFKPSSGSHGHPISPYPRQLERKTSAITENGKVRKEKPNKESWKFNSFGKSRPTPSITFRSLSLKLCR